MPNKMEQNEEKVWVIDCGIASHHHSFRYALGNTQIGRRMWKAVFWKRRRGRLSAKDYEDEGWR